MIYLKLQGIILAKEKTKEKDARVYILTKQNGIIKCHLKGLYQIQSKNLSLMEPGNLNRFFILTNLEKFRIISALPLKVPGKIFQQFPYIYLWTLKLVKNANLLETPPFIWFVLKHLEKYLQQNPRNFPYWFIYHLKKELGYEPDLDRCYSCQKKLNKFAYFDNKHSLYCLYCKKQNYKKIEEKDLKIARKIKNPFKIPSKIPDFLKKILMLKFD